MKPVQVMTVTVGAEGAAEDPLLIRASKSLRDAGFEVMHERALGTDPKVVQALVQRFAGDLDAIVVLGGDGIGRKDTVPELLQKSFEQELPGFGERFRAALAQQPEAVASALLCRATAGIFSACAIFLLPHSENGVALGVEKLVVPMLGPLIASIRSA